MTTEQATPRTDARSGWTKATGKLVEVGKNVWVEELPEEYVHANFCRELERALAAAEAKLKDLQSNKYEVRIQHTGRTDSYFLPYPVAERITTLEADLAKRTEELAEARKDAGRYRWLRVAAVTMNKPPEDLEHAGTSEEMDAAIDAAISQAEGKP